MDPTDEQERSKFAHAVWNASIVLCDMIGCSFTTLSSRTEKEGEEEEVIGKEAIMCEE